MTRPRLPDAGALAELPAPRDTTLPNGFAVELADDVHRSRDGGLMLGGSPPRLLRLGKPAARLLEPGRFTVTDAATAALGRRLVDIGVVHPRLPVEPVRDVTIVIPVRDGTRLLNLLLTALRADPQTSGVPVLVVDDGSVNRAAVDSVTRRHGAALLVHSHNQGPAAARNTGLRHARTGYVAFCDSDVLPEAGWLSPLLAQFVDPALALAAPRVVGIPKSHPGWLDQYDDVRSPLDMGGREAPVVPLSALAYVPGATLVVRRAAVGGGFAPELRIGEDVDLCLRLHRAGWRMRYVPSSRVGHCHRANLRSWLAQRASYGSGAAGLALRHPGQVPPLNAAPWSIAACALVLRGRPVPVGVAVALTAGTAIRLIRRIPDADTPVRAGALLTLAAVRGTAEQLTGGVTRHYWPVAVLAAAANRRARNVLVLSAVVEGFIDYRRSGSSLNPLAYLLIRWLDDLAYGAGLWRGAIRDRTTAPLIPRLAYARDTSGWDRHYQPGGRRRGGLPARVCQRLRNTIQGDGAAASQGATVPSSQRRADCH
ncbi:MAG TPA: mycofactocin biosynthesis glycosyltransferase MftF [Streptosporangiaceae bacterium]|nr:mycofactocin biosynthesis glycosyltransferase MftF [Streptosporangiaceae bacterium]